MRSIILLCALVMNQGCTAELPVSPSASSAGPLPASMTASERQGKADGWDQALSTLDVYYQKMRDPDSSRPVIVFIHGGGWHQGDKSYIGKPANRKLFMVSSLLWPGLSHMEAEGEQLAPVGFWGHGELNHLCPLTTALRGITHR